MKVDISKKLEIINRVVAILKKRSVLWIFIAVMDLIFCCCHCCTMCDLMFIKHNTFHGLLLF